MNGYPGSQNPQTEATWAKASFETTSIPWKLIFKMLSGLGTWRVSLQIIIHFMKRKRKRNNQEPRFENHITELNIKSCDKLEGHPSNFNTVKSSAFSPHSDYALSLHTSLHYCGILITSVNNPDMLVMWGEDILQYTYANKQMSVLVTEVFSPPDYI